MRDAWCSGMFLMAIASSFAVLLVARVLQGGSDALLWTAGIAWVSSSAPPGSRGSRISVVQAAGAAGFIAGPILGAIAVSGVGVAETFLALSAISLVLLALVVTIPAPARQLVEHKPSLIPMLAACSRQSLITASILLIFVAAIVGGALQLLITLQLSDGGMSASRIGAIYTAGAVLSAGVAVLTGRGGDRYGRVPVAIVGTAVLAAAVAALALPIPERGFVALTILTFGLEAVLYATAYPLSVDGADRSQLGHGVVLGVVNLAWGIGAVVGPLGGSVLGSVTGTTASYVLIGAFTAAACLYIRSSTLPARPPLRTDEFWVPPGSELLRIPMVEV